MGYYTSFSLEIIEGDDHIKDWEQEISDSTLYEGSNLFSGEQFGWYDCDADMLSFSTLYPNVLFSVTGIGEESGDMWRAYYKNGKMQRCQAVITYDEYDPAKLR
jgi:hypothetical protein